MSTSKKTPSNLPGGLTPEEVKDLQNLDDLLDKMQSEPVQGLTPEEWDDFFKELKSTGEIPERYKGRVAENEVTVKYAYVDGKRKHYPEGIKRKAYYDIARETRNKKNSETIKPYEGLIRKLIINMPEDQIEGNIDEIIKRFLTSPALLEALERMAKAEQKNELAPLGAAPNGEALAFLFRLLNNSKGGRYVQESNGNRHEVIKVIQEKNKIRFERKNTNSGTTSIIEIDNAEKHLKNTSKTFSKLFLFVLQKMVAQHAQKEVVFSLQELVDLGVYKTTSNALRAFKSFFVQQKDTQIGGTTKKGKKLINEDVGILFYHYYREPGYIRLCINANFNIDLIASYFTIFPRFAYALNNNAFSLVRYIFFLARQNTEKIKNNGKFTISLENVRENLGLPSIDEVKNRKYRQFIIEPIEAAIEEIEEAARNVPEAQEYNFTITPCGTNTSKINEWLQGYLEIGLKEDFAKTFEQIATKAEQDRIEWEKAKRAELAKIAAREEAKTTKK